MFHKKIQKRAYQVRAAKFAMASKKRRILIVAPGGSGKTVIAALIVMACFARKRPLRVLLLSHRREIVKQTSDTLQGRIAIGVIMPGFKPDPSALIQVASIGSLFKRKLPVADVVIVDEAHRAASAGYEKVLRHYERKKARIIGLSATPYRLDGQGLKKRFDVMYEAAKPSQLLGKYIMKPVVFSAAPEDLPNLLGVKKIAGDFNPRELVRRVNKHGLVASIAKTAKKHLGDRLAVVFCVSVTHSKRVAARLRLVGFKAMHIDGSFTAKERTDVLDKLKSGELQIVTCCMILTEGWDLPDCDAVIMARPTCSLSLFIQMAARAARKGRRRPIILDHACNTIMHNYSWIDREWSLDGKLTGSPSTVSDLKRCSGCGCMNPTEATHCEECSKPFPKRPLTLKERAELELVEWKTKEAVRRSSKIDSFVAKHRLSKTWAKRAKTVWLKSLQSHAVNS